MDTTGYFNYPTIAAAPEDAPERGFLDGATMEEWDAVLAATETLRFHPGDVVLRAGERDRAFYILLDGRLELDGGYTVTAPTALGGGAFLDDQPRSETLRARGHGELARMSWEAYEALAARDPRLGRSILVELGRLLAAQLRTAALPGWTG
jgi:CRP/FNR family transcriptional regulator, cyclic AMP receptor protein